MTLEKLSTGIAGFDEIADGGLPTGRSVVVTGTSGSCKTVFAVQFLVAGARDQDQNGVLVTFEESPRDLIANMRSFGWDLEELIARKQIGVVDATVEPGAEVVASGRYDLSALLARIESAIQDVQATRVVLDAVGTLFPQVSDANVVRRELHRICLVLRRLGVTTLITTERKHDDEGSGAEEFVADNVVVLRNRLEQEQRRRTVEVLKFRGATHRTGEFPFTVEGGRGMTVIPHAPAPSDAASSEIRASSGIPELDKMCGGGFYRDAIVLVSGATGTGKTVLATEYVRAAIDARQRALYVAAGEQSREQLVRDGASRGADLGKAERDGLLRIVRRTPEAMGLEDHLLQTVREIREFGPTRVVVDSISSFERCWPARTFREFVVALTRRMRALGVLGLFTHTGALFANGADLGESHVAAVSDAIILLRHVEMRGVLRRALAVLKMRGGDHEKEIREYIVDRGGLHIMAPFRDASGVLAGAPTFPFVEAHAGEILRAERSPGERLEAPRIGAKTIRRT